MREILFRGKDEETGEWLQSMTISKHFYNDEEFFSYYIGHGNRTIDAKTLGQYTGLTDKNGTKIFDGDILKVKTMWHAEFPNVENCFEPPIKKETYWSVEYKDFRGEMGFMVYGIDRRFHKPLTWNRLYNTEAEVVGNIYDNPELMKGGAET